MRISDEMVERGARGIAAFLSDGDGGPRYDDLSVKNKEAARDTARAALTAALSDQVVVANEHKTIWLQPWCEGCEKNCNSGEGRLWCKDDVWGKCEECDRMAVKYVVAAAPPPASPAGEGNSSE